MSEEADKPHAPSPRKLQDARRKGEVARSADLNAFALYLGALLAGLWLSPTVAERLIRSGGALLAAGESLSMGAGGTEALRAILVGAGALAAGPALAVAAAIAVQRSAVMAPARLAPKLSRISPVSGLKNKFGPQGLFEFAKSAAKMALYGALLAGLLWTAAPEIGTAAALPPGQGFALTARLALAALALVALIAAVLGAIDHAWQRHAHLAKHRMSHQEMRDEQKDQDGDPAFKAHRRRRAQEIATNRMLADVPDAAVVVVNPTHYAVALRWSPTDPSPPVCVAKGTDEIARRIREVAEAARVPIRSDPPTARALHASVEVGAAIPRAHFAAVAAAIRFAEALRGQAR